MRIELANTGDAKEIAKVHVDSWLDSYRGIIPDAYLDSLAYDERAERWKKILSDKVVGNYTRVARDEQNKIVGFVSVGANREPLIKSDGEIYGIYLAKAVRKTGLGKKMIVAGLEQLFRSGFYQAAIWVLAENPALGFYKHLGARVVAEKNEEIGGKKLREFGLVWDDIADALKKLAPTHRHPNIINYQDIKEADGFNHYDDSAELHSIGSPLARAIGLRKLGIHHELLPPGRRTSWPHAESDEEEMIYVIAGHPHVWIDGELHQLGPGDAVGFIAGTGICHTFINNTKTDVRLLVVGEATKPTNKVLYPLHLDQREKRSELWWHDAPKRPLGKHDGKPDA